MFPDPGPPPMPLTPVEIFNIKTLSKIEVGNLILVCITNISFKKSNTEFNKRFYIF